MKNTQSFGRRRAENTSESGPERSNCPAVLLRCEDLPQSKEQTMNRKSSEPSQYTRPGHDWPRSGEVKPGKEGDPFDSGEGKSDPADFDRNRSGVYGGRPERRGYDPKKANDPSANQP